MARGRKRKFRFKPGFNFDPKLITVCVWSVVSLLALAGISYMVYRSSLFTVKTVTSNVIIPKVIENKAIGESIFSLDIKSIQKEILGNSPEFRSVSIIKRFPSTVVVNVVERKPFAQFKTHKFFVIDREGVILAPARPDPYPDLVTIEINDYRPFLRAGLAVNDPRLGKALELLDTVRSFGIDGRYRLREINATVLGSLYFVIDDTEVRVGRSNFRKKIDLLNTLLRDKLTDGLSTVKYIDLRYERVYIGYKR